MKSYKNIDEYIEDSDQKVKILLQKLRHTIKKSAPKATETINYGIPTFKLNGKNLVHFGGFKNHIGFYPTPGGIKEFEQELKTYSKSKGAVQFPLDKPLPTGLIEKIVKFRAQEIKRKG